MAQPEDILNDLFSAYRNTSSYKDQAMMELFAQRKTFEERLDKMWRICLTGNVRQIIEYRKQIDDIKSCGLKVLRNSAGKHKIVTK